jgi:hypothetical protein
MPRPFSARLLIVDDEAALMGALCKTLRDEGYAVTGATSGAEAIALLKDGGFDLLMTDLMMPRMDGIALVRQALTRDPGLVAIVMTGQGSIPTAVEAMKTGAVDYVLKPFKLSAMLPVLERALMLRRLRLKNVELEQRVQLRTAELEAANHELDQFAHSVSHDLRTPLRAVAGFAEILRQHHAGELSDEARRLIGLIAAGAAEMDQLTNDLLEFSRLGRQTLARQAIEPERLCREVFDSLEHDRAARRVELQLGTLPAVSADPALLRVALVNLLSNALKYTRQRDPALIEIGCQRPAKGAPIFFVRDNGAGFDPVHASRLFGVFERLHSGDQFEGTGVGLATVRRIIERHGGRIWAESAPDRGATFFFTLAAD